MATVKVKFRPSSLNDREGTIYYQVTHNRVVRQVTIGYKVYLWEWDEKHRNVFVKPNEQSETCFSSAMVGKGRMKLNIIMPDDAERTERLMSISDNIRWDMNRFNRIIASFIQRGIPFSAEDIVEEFLVFTSRLSLSNFMESLIARLRHDGRQRTSETYRAALNSFSRFRNGDDVMLDALSQDMLESYEAHLQVRGLVPNSISFHLRILRAVYNRAREHGLIPPAANPFAHVYTGVEKTAKRAVDIKTIRRIKNLELGKDRSAGYARDMFMLSFYLRGMSFVDLAYLRKSDLRDGVVTYRRRKTGQKLSIRWTEEMQEVLDKYPQNETEFLFPIINPSWRTATISTGTATTE